MSIYRRVAQAKGINNHIYSPEFLQEEEEPQLERAATGARPHLARSEGWRMKLNMSCSLCVSAALWACTASISSRWASA